MRKRYIQRGLELVEVGDDYIPEPRADFHVMSDIKPYRSMIDGREITSRSKHRDHLKAYGCVEIGNDSSLLRKTKGQTPPPGLKEKVIRAVEEVTRRR